MDSFARKICFFPHSSEALAKSIGKGLTPSLLIYPIETESGIVFCVKWQWCVDGHRLHDYHNDEDIDAGGGVVGRLHTGVFGSWISIGFANYLPAVLSTLYTIYFLLNYMMMATMIRKVTSHRSTLYNGWILTQIYATITVLL